MRVVRSECVTKNHSENERSLACSVKLTQRIARCCEFSMSHHGTRDETILHANTCIKYCPAFETHISALSLNTRCCSKPNNIGHRAQMQPHTKEFKDISSQGEFPASPYLRPMDKKRGGYVETDLESNDSTASGLSFATASSSVADTLSTASYATAPSKYSYWSDGYEKSASQEIKARALASDPDSIIEALARCEILSATNLPQAINIAKDIMETCIELLSDSHVFLMPVRTTLGSLYIKAGQFEAAEINLQAAFNTWLENQSQENEGIEQILFPLGKRHFESQFLSFVIF